ncbi:MAG TPA: MotA/TolQ/ExbB proton channel family protein [Sedimentisphaerales bacterium]|nr:MotA/TolQ/ExbB proton channel family protein [Sedimentisphaerales bacterium]
MRNWILALVMSSTLLATVASAQTAARDGAPSEALEAAVLKTKADIDAATVELQQLRDEIAAQRKPLSGQLQSLQKEVKLLRAEAERARQFRRQGQEQQAALITQTDALQEECRFLLTVFSEYRRSLETRVSEAESAWIQDALAAIDRDLTDEDTFSRLPAAVAKLLELSADWNERRLGGAGFDGAALDAAGVEHAGRFAVLGPVTYFASSDGTRAGLAVTRFGNSQPSLYESHAGDDAQVIVALVRGQEAMASVDVTSGDALKVEKAKQTFVEHVQKGGFVMIPLLLVGILAAVLSLWKAIDLTRVRVRGGAALDEILADVKAGQIEAARSQASRLQEPLASLVCEGIDLRDAPREHLEEIMHEHVLGYVPRLERHLGTLAVFGGIAPLLGLLGTVTGMIHTFQLVTIFGSGDAKLLSGGISEALITTEFGLAIAIPVLLVHAFLSRRARTVIGRLEQTAAGFVNGLKVRASGT